MNLVIVESPAKAKTIEKYLGKDYKVLASFGHVRDLPKTDLGIDVENDFQPKYLIPTKAKKTITEIKNAEKKAELLYLATDLDREGEAISWHILQALKIKNDSPKVKRIVFHEITKTAIQNAVKNPRTVDMNLVDAQQARRVLDRLVGYKLSPLLWKKVKSGLSAGRVQSVAVRLIVEREREIEKFQAQEYWVLGAILSKQNDKKQFSALLSKFEGKTVSKLGIQTKEDALEIGKVLTNADYKVLDVVKKESLRKAPAPFTTSTLQIEASRKLGYSAKQTMMIAQKLYEAGHITYMRTDSTNLSAEAIRAIRELIKNEMGEKYLPEVEQKYQTKTKRAQEAHEAIRPAHFDAKIVSSESREQRLYELIWKRAVSSQMKNAIFDITEAIIEAKADKTAILSTKGEVLKFDGFMKIYLEGKDEEVEEKENLLPELAVGEQLDYHNLIKEQKFTEPPKRYTEAMLVKKLESLGIGRPSTYAPTLSTIQDRGYVLLEEKKFHPTEIAGIVNDLLVQHFSNIVDYDFTAKMEDNFDAIASGEEKWVPVIRDFYEPFEKQLKEKSKEIVKEDIIKPEILEEKCPECGEPLMVRLGRYGKFIACSGYPKCKYSRPLEEATKEMSKGEKEAIKELAGEVCEKCGGKMVLKEGRFGKFMACENYPECKYTKAISQSTGVKCPECKKGDVIQRRTKKGRIFWGCSNYPKCKYATWENPNQANKQESK